MERDFSIRLGMVLSKILDSEYATKGQATCEELRQEMWEWFLASNIVKACRMRLSTAKENVFKVIPMDCSYLPPLRYGQKMKLVLDLTYKRSFLRQFKVRVVC